jgi:hypothetical protein
LVLGFTSRGLLRRPAENTLEIELDEGEDEDEEEGDEPAPEAPATKPAAEPADPDGYEGLWAQGPIHCLVCNHRWVAVYPAETDPTTLQCPSCDLWMTEPE